MLSRKNHSGPFRFTTLFVSAVGLATAIGVTSASCGSDETSTGATTGDGGSGQTVASSSAASTGGAGGATSSSTGGGGGDTGCKSDADCVNDPVGPICDVTDGQCYECLPANDTCDPGQYCTDRGLCQVGCTDQTDCNTDTTCDTNTHKCVGCVIDTDCPSGSICISSTCVPGCSGTQPCEAGSTCCGQQCFDLSSDENHCGTCIIACAPYAHADPLCDNGGCVLGPCNPGYADCNLNSMDGCEWNTLHDGPCACNVGDMQPC